MATALRNCAYTTRGNESRILLLYGDSLRRVGKALEEAQGVFQHEHCVAILCLSATNIVIPQARSDWATHAKGVGAMIERLGPKPFSTGILHTLFVGFRPLLLISSIYDRRKTFLAQDGWVTKPFETVPISIMQLLLNKATQLPALLERFDSLGDRSITSNVVAMQRLRDDFLYMIKSLKYWELSSKAQAKFSLVWPKPNSPDAESLGRKPLWFANVLVASSLTHCWAFEIVARQHLDDIEESIAEIKGCNVKAVPRRSDSASDKDENPVSILAEKICDSMPYFLQPELKLYGPASTFFTFLTAMKVFKHKKTYCANNKYFPNPLNMSTQLKLLANYGVTGFLLSTGLFALLAPTTFAAGFGMPVPADSFASGFVQCVGGRNLTFGIIAAIFLQRGDVRAVSLMATMLAVDGVVDGLVTMKHAGMGFALPHFGAAAIIPFVSSWMAS
ncbi:unnamed protein product [Alternaria alternata]